MELAGVDDGFRPVPCHQLAEELVHVRFDRALGDLELGGNLAVGLALGKQQQDLELAAGQRLS